MRQFVASCVIATPRLPASKKLSISRSMTRSRSRRLPRLPRRCSSRVPIGQNGKTLAQTNLVVGGQLQYPQYLELHSISVPIANNTTLTDLINILSLVSFTLTVGTKPMLQVPVWFLPSGCGAILNAVAGIGSSLPATAAVGYSTGNGIADPRAVFALSCPFVINTGESFNVTLNPETPFNTQANTTNPPGLGTTISVKLDGVLYRGVQ